MPSKRQPSKQRRAAQNRAKSQSLAARRENASHPAPSASGSSGARSSGSGNAASAPARRPGLLGSLLGPTPAAPNPGGSTEVVGNPGRTAVLVSLVLALGAGVAILFILKQPVDDRGDPVPLSFGGLYVKARGALTGGAIETTDKPLLEALGGLALVWALLPAVIAVGAYLVYRVRRAKEQTLYWPMTGAMVLMALAVMLFGASYAMPAMVALAIASFQVRKAEMPARMAERAAAQASEDDEADEYDEEDEYDDEEEAEYEDEEGAEYEDEDDEVVDEDDEVVEEESPKK